MRAAPRQPGWEGSGMEQEEGMVYRRVEALVQYGVHTGLVGRDDAVYTRNRLYGLLHLDGPEGPCAPAEEFLVETLDGLCGFAYEKGLIGEDTVSCRDRFDTALMGALTPRPSEVIRRFREEYRKSPRQATDFFYRFSQDTNYIRRDRAARDIKWKTPTKYGELDITINLSKPEKDPKAIVAAKNRVQAGYPKCLLCRESEGYAGRADYPARHNHRIIPIGLDGEEWFFQYSPYSYYREHCIVLKKEHVPMKLTRRTFYRLLGFVEQFPHYFIGSNADLPIVGGSILTHDHFQGGCFALPIERAENLAGFKISGFEDVQACKIKWPMYTLRLRGKDEKRLAEAGFHVLSVWRDYTDASAFVYARTENTPHNTVTPVARFRDGMFELDLILRNNITTPEHPLGVFHPHADKHHIKKENIGLIEAMGLAILPPRLKESMELIRDALLCKKSISEIGPLAPHREWIDAFLEKYGEIGADNIDGILRTEIGLVFEAILGDAGVFKDTPEGNRAGERFLARLGA